MALDAYTPCPCGSGKKLKFCCHEIASEMEKVIRLRQNNQPHVALQRLEELGASHPANPWVITSRATILLSEGRAEEAHELLADFHERHPDHIFGLALYASAAFNAQGYERSRKIIHRAFQKCGAAFPEMVGGLALGIAAIMLMTGRFLSAREHLGLAMRFAKDEQRQVIFTKLIELDGNRHYPYPLRSVHELAAYVGDDDDIQRGTIRAKKLLAIGCFGPAARLFGRLAEQEPDNAALWQNVGLCQAWDGDEVSAAQSLHLAATLHDDFPTAVECETMAQLLDRRNDEDVGKVRDVSYRVKSVSKLLTELGRHERFARLRIPPLEEDVQEPAGLFHVLDRAVPDGNAAPLTIDDVPNVLAELEVYDADDDEPANASVIALEGDALETARRLLEEAAGDQVEATTGEEDDDEAPVVEFVPREIVPLHWKWHFPEATPMVLRSQLRFQKLEQLLNEVWPESPLSGLGGQTPAAAIGDADQRIPLAAALSVLDAYCNSEQCIPDLEPLRQRLQLDPLEPLDVSDDTSLGTLSPLQLTRLPVEDLSDAQLEVVFKRSALLHLGGFLKRVLCELMRRPGLHETVDLDGAYRLLVSVCSEQNRRDEALQWLEKAREWAGTRDDAFERLLHWNMLEVNLRLEDPDDPALPGLLKQVWDQYGPKLPNLRPLLQELVSAYRVEPPWDEHEVVAEEAVGSSRPSGIWTPESPAAGSAASQKIWLPGQE